MSSSRSTFGKKSSVTAKSEIPSRANGPSSYKRKQIYVRKASSSQTCAVSSPAKTQTAPVKDEYFHFGSISPGFVNGMQARVESFLAVPTVAVPTTQRQQAEVSKQVLEVDPYSVSWVKIEPQVSPAPSSSLPQKPPTIQFGGIPVQLPFLQQQVHLPYSVPNPPIQAQGVAGASMHMPLPMHFPTLDSNETPTNLTHDSRSFVKELTVPVSHDAVGTIHDHATGMMSAEGNHDDTKFPQERVKEKASAEDQPQGSTLSVATPPDIVNDNTSRVSDNTALKVVTEESPLHVHKMTLKSSESSELKEKNQTSRSVDNNMHQYTEHSTESEVPLDMLGSEAVASSDLSSYQRSHMTDIAIRNLESTLKSSIPVSDLILSSTGVNDKQIGDSLPSLLDTDMKGKMVTDQMPESASSIGKKIFQELFQKVGAARSTFDLYNADKAPGEHKDMDLSPKSEETGINEAKLMPSNTFTEYFNVSEAVSQYKGVPNDSEDAYDVAALEIGAQDNGQQHEELSQHDYQNLTNKYSRDISIPPYVVTVSLTPQTPTQMMHRAEKKYEVGKQEAKRRKLRAILNKLTPQNFLKLFEQVKAVNIDRAVTVIWFVSQIFERVLADPIFCEMYADFCYHLSGELPDFNDEKEKITFKRVLLNKCQEEFEKMDREQEEPNQFENSEITQTKEEREERRVLAKRRMLCNIRFLGELYKKKMLTERIMHESIKSLLGQLQNPDEEDLEALCILMSTIGDMIDHPRAKSHMDVYFDVMGMLSINMNLSSRVRFMLKDTIDLRSNNWHQRRKMEGPKKIDEVRWDAAKYQQAKANHLARVPGSNASRQRGPPSQFGSRGFTTMSSLKSNSMTDQPTFSSSDDAIGRLAPERYTISDLQDKHEGQGRYEPSNRETSNIGSSFDKKSKTSPKSTYSQDRLQDIPLAAIKEFYSAKDEKEVDSHGFYSSMIALWVTYSFEWKDTHREQLTSLLINLSKPSSGILSQQDLLKGFKSVLATLENAVKDTPRAPEFLGHILAKSIVENVIDFADISSILHKGGEKPGTLLESGLAGDIVGIILEVIQADKGDSVMKEILANANFQLEDFQPPGLIGYKKLEKFISQVSHI